MNPEQYVDIDPEILNIDTDLHRLVANIDVLEAITPLNYQEERQLFFDGLYSNEPDFQYRESDIDRFGLKRALFSLPLEKIVDPDLGYLYMEVINSYVDRINLCKSIGTPEFLYDSLRYFGEPSDKDIKNAQFVLHLPDTMEEDEITMVGAQDIRSILSEFAVKHEYPHEIIIDPKMMANALVSGLRVKINTNAEVSRVEAHALAHHELGVHLVTTLNARSQNLKILSLGCPVNTMTQEGLAILSEYLSGNLTPNRLKNLALRVLAVESMMTTKSFRNTFLLLHEEHGVEAHQAFTITARVFRGGGYTKDYLYLQGFHQVLNAYEQEENFLDLLIGKTSLDLLPTLSMLVQKGILLPPKHITPAFQSPSKVNEIMKFVTHAIK